MDKSYLETVRLLLEAMPAVFQTPAFAMKRGTAINFFVKLFLRPRRSQVKVEVNHVFRGTVLPAERRSIGVADIGELGGSRVRLALNQNDNVPSASNGQCDAKMKTTVLQRCDPLPGPTLKPGKAPEQLAQLGSKGLLQRQTSFIACVPGIDVFTMP